MMTQRGEQFLSLLIAFLSVSLLLLVMVLFVIKNGANWLWFLKNTVHAFQGIQLVVSDYDKGLHLHNVQSFLVDNNVTT